MHPSFRRAQRGEILTLNPIGIEILRTIHEKTRGSAQNDKKDHID
jgi:hypothetical protein